MPISDLVPICGPQPRTTVLRSVPSGTPATSPLVWLIAVESMMSPPKEPGPPSLKKPLAASRSMGGTEGTHRTMGRTAMPFAWLPDQGVTTIPVPVPGWTVDVPWLPLFVSLLDLGCCR